MSWGHATSFQHEALLYGGEDEFLTGTGRFIRKGLEADEPVMVVVSAAKIELLQEELGPDADAVTFADMALIGANPARIIPAWRDFVDEHAAPGRGLWGVGEPIFPERTSAALVECQRHEALLNLAFADTPGFHLLCPYDTTALEPAVIEEAHRTHPVIARGAVRRQSVVYHGLEPIAEPFAAPLPEPESDPQVLAFRGAEPATFRALRAFIAASAAAAGLPEARADDLVLAVHELATNSVRHAGGEGSVLIWQEGDTLICEVRDAGRIDRPLAGRERPVLDPASGWGLWLVNHLCELVQVRTFPTGTAVRVHVQTA